MLRRVRIVWRYDSALQRLHEVRHQGPMLRRKTVDERAAVKINDQLSARIFLRRDGPNKMSIDFSFCDVMFTMQATRRFGVRSLPARNSLSHAIYRSLHAKNVEDNVNHLRL